MAVNLGDLLKDVPKFNTGREQIEYIRLDLIDDDAKNFYSTDEIESLARNIDTVGLLDPLRIRDNPEAEGRYKVVSGHRRRLALKLLVQDDPEQWREVACIHEKTAASPTLQQLRLIFANSDNRKMSPSDTSKQAVQVEELLYKLKEEEGYEFPGRMRDHVAQVVGVSKSKLARLKVIRDNLDECWMSDFESNALHESTAYYLSQLPKDEQFFIYDYMEGTKGSASSVSAAVVEAYKDRLEPMKDLLCPTEGIPCENMENKREATIRTGIYDFHPCSKCCASCYKLTTCRYACPKLADQIAQQKAEHLAESRRKKAAEAEKDAPAIEAITRIWRRFGELREESGASVESARKALGYSCAVPDKQFRELERGKYIHAETLLPLGSILLHEVEGLVKLADLFGCSLDYLLCRTDVREMAQEGCGEYTMDYGDPVTLWTLMPQEKDVSAAPPAVTGWQSGSPEAYGTYVAYVRLTGVAAPMLRELLWDGEDWFLYGKKIADDVTVQCWMERPDF